MKRYLVLFLPLATSACLAAPKADPTYCGSNEGDRFCSELDPSKPYCVLATDACYEANGLGLEGSSCITELPAEECRNECGIDEAGCNDPTDPTLSESSSTGETETGPTTETDPGTETETTGPTSDTTTTGPTGCQGPDDCNDPALPFCVDEVCVACSAAAEPDTACAELDEAFPLCIEDDCVQCSADDAQVCGGATPLCDVEASTCVACEFHEQCQDIGSPACNFVTGACFDPANVTEVNAGTAGSIQTAIDAVDDGAEHAIVLTGSGATNHSITVDAGKTIAIVSTNTSAQNVRGNSGNPTLTVTGAGTTVFLHRLELTLNGDDVGISVEASAALFADSVQVTGNGGGGINIATGCSAQLRNTMIGGDVNTDAISNGGTLDALYATVVGNFGASSTALACSGGTTTIRNSILASRSADAVNCPGVDTSNTFEAQGGAYQETWFDLDGGDLSLNSAADFDGVAIWEDGDPPFDFEGDARPNTDGAADYAGADTP